MDVLTIILIFLLVNYSEDTEETVLPDFVEMPTLISNKANAKKGVAIFIGAKKLSIGKGKDISYENFENEEEAILGHIKESLEMIKIKNEEIKKPTYVAIAADKEMPYQIVNSVIVAAGSVGITNIEFLALKKKD